MSNNNGFNKKLLLIPIGVGVLIWIIASLYDKDIRDTLGDKFSMKVPKMSDCNMSQLKGLDLFIDFSGSMRGFIDFQGEGEATMIPIVGNFLNNVETRTDIVSDCHIREKGKNTILKKDDFCNKMRNNNICSGQNTKLDEFIKSSCESLSDSTVSVVVSDMVLSYGKTELINKGKYYNKNNLAGLESSINSIFSEVQKKGYDVILLQFNVDYNGKYYCNYTENIVPNVFKDSILKERPFYMLMIGKKEHIECLINDVDKARPYKTIYASYNIQDYVDHPCSVKNGDDAGSYKLGVDKNSTGCLYTEHNYEGKTSSFTITYEGFQVPAHIQVESLEPEWDNNIIESASLSNDNINFTLKSYMNLPKNEIKETWIYLVSDVSYKVDEIDDDTDISTKDFQGKTWGFHSFVKGLKDAYKNRQDKDIVAKIKFNIYLKK